MTSQDLIQILINFVAVAGGLFVLWSFVGRMRDLPVGTRAGFAAVAGLFSAAVTMVVTLLTGGGTTGAPVA